MTRESLQCVQCGQVDDHPKSHWDTGETYHHDCLPFARKRELAASSEHGAAIIAAAESGIRGDALLEHIRSLHGQEQQ